MLCCLLRVARQGSTRGKNSPFPSDIVRGSLRQTNGPPGGPGFLEFFKPSRTQRFPAGGVGVGGDVGARWAPVSPWVLQKTRKNKTRMVFSEGWPRGNWPWRGVGEERGALWVSLPSASPTSAFRRNDRWVPELKGIVLAHMGGASGGPGRALPCPPSPHTLFLFACRCSETPGNVLEEILLSDHRGCCCLTNELSPKKRLMEKKFLPAVQRLSKFPSADSFGRGPEP